ncbi:MAG: peptidoglycan-binding domain-containing protein [Paraclostridium sp.]
MTGYEVNYVQDRLKKIGYYEGNIDGSLGSVTWQELFGTIPSGGAPGRGRKIFIDVGHGCHD